MWSRLHSPLTTTDEHVTVVVVLSSSLLPGIKFQLSLFTVRLSHLFPFVKYFVICSLKV